MYVAFRHLQSFEYGWIQSAQTRAPSGKRSLTILWSCPRTSHGSYHTASKSPAVNAPLSRQGLRGDRLPLRCCHGRCCPRVGPRMTRRYAAPTQLGRRGSRAAQFLPRGQTPSSAQPTCASCIHVRTYLYLQLFGTWAFRHKIMQFYF